jgi:hypothetical protein
MKNLEFQHNIHLAAVYYNDEKSNLYRIQVNVTLGDLKNQLAQLSGRLHFRDQRRATDVEYRFPSVCSQNRPVHQHETLNYGDVRIMFSIFSQYMTKGPIELDAKLDRSVQAICQNLMATKIADGGCLEFR